jgi:DNA-binding NarL/FixJ family response regulator
MEPITAIVIGILTIIGSGSLTKVGENITDGTGDLAKSLWAMLKRKAPETQTVRLLESGQELDIQQAVIDLEPIASDVSDPDVAKLLEEVRSLLASNQELAAKVEALRSQLSQSKSRNPNKLAEKIGIVVQSGGKADIATFNM